MSKSELFAHFKQYNRVARMYRKESDRAAALLSASYLETLLEKLLRTKFVQFPATNMFSGNGPLATFSSRIDLAYALGLFGKDQYHDLSLIRRIRNEFAHSFNYIAFTEPAIRDRCADFAFIKWLSSVTQNAPHSPRDQYLLAVVSISTSVTSPFHDEWLNGLTT